ncbi:hypothetical protein MKZ38_004639 [Zalerion maritima]|uniref:Uncharacterized protein n=1 Tax=Zalerion maritima TaxID=339359 RepID=A0AAD5WQU7_9PEZI|nr:hypothetical protein MKZ38_004639 [Zalerion maritima]
MLFSNTLSLALTGLAQFHYSTQAQRWATLTLIFNDEQAAARSPLGARSYNSVSFKDSEKGVWGSCKSSTGTDLANPQALQDYIDASQVSADTASSITSSEREWYCKPDEVRLSTNTDNSDISQPWGDFMSDIIAVRDLCVKALGDEEYNTFSIEGHAKGGDDDTDYDITVNRKSCDPKPTGGRPCGAVDTQKWRI